MFLTISVFGGCWLLPACQFFCHRPCLGICTQVGVKVGRLVHGYRPHGLLNDVGNGRVRYLVAAESLVHYLVGCITIYHFDFYRIKKLEEVYDMGYEDYFYGGGICLIEWPELIEDLLPEDAVHVDIKENEDGTRSVKF